MDKNRHIISTRNYNKIKSLGRGTDTELRELDNEVNHVTSWESYLMDNYGEEGKDIVRAVGSGTTNPFTGLKEREPVTAAVATTTAASTTVPATTGAMAAIGTAAPVIGMALQVGQMLWGAHKKQKEAKRQKGLLETGIADINDSRVKLGETATDEITNMWENVGEKLSDVRYNVGESYGNVKTTADNIVKRGKGLSTGASETMINEVTSNAQDNLTRTTETLVDSTTADVDKYSNKIQDETTSMTRKVKDMESQIDGLDTSFWGNVLA